MRYPFSRIDRTLKKTLIYRKKVQHRGTNIIQSISSMNYRVILSKLNGYTLEGKVEILNYPQTKTYHKFHLRTSPVEAQNNVSNVLFFEW